MSELTHISWTLRIGRALMAMLFLAGAVQKAVAPEQAMALLTGLGLPGWLIWPALVFTAVTGLALLLGFATRWVALALSVYCMVTSVFHFQPEDGWQMSIFVKNWAIAGGLLVLSDHARRFG
ncbi:MULTISPECIES: DoxX family protein [unclassified Roseovarius]|uniref:DoxX family protein n=1 Tax=unclassified Roseovarius TaxID=2614913 RepID=UPI00273D0770|nr:DoxX family protein [Roseovarius sp. MMSF_3350]